MKDWDGVAQRLTDEANYNKLVSLLSAAGRTARAMVTPEEYQANPWAVKTVSVRCWPHGAQETSIDGNVVHILYSTGDQVFFSHGRVWRVIHSNGRVYTFENPPHGGV